jgi:hypothetical protein
LFLFIKIFFLIGNAMKLKIILLLTFLFQSLTSYATSYTATDQPSNYTTNYTAIAQSTVTSSSTDSSDDDGSGKNGWHWVKPFTGKFPNIKPNWKNCYTAKWSVKQVKSSTMFNPKISVTADIVVACVGFKGNVTLNAFGQCKLINLTRVCARFTAPCEHGNDRCCDAANCSCQDASGNDIQPDAFHQCNPSSKSCPGCENKKKWRICAFEDPKFPFDLNDMNANSMPFQEKTKVPPSIQSGMSLIALGGLLVAAGILVPGLGQLTMMAGLTIMAAGGMMELLRYVSKTINYNVVANRGCVDMSLAPSPPPYCSSIQGYKPQANVISICHYSPEYKMSSATSSALAAAGVSASDIAASDYKQVSTLDKPCDIGGTTSEIYSSFENPSVRVSFNNPLPICTTSYTGSGGMAKDVCVIAQNIYNPLYLWKKAKNLIPLCSASITSNCVQFPSGRVTGTAAPFRPYYYFMNSGTSTSSNQPMPFGVTPSDSSTPSLVLAGINNAKFLDGAPGSIMQVTDFTNVARRFLVAFNDTGDVICVYERNDPSNNNVSMIDSDTEISCLNRPLPMNPPSVISCTSSNISSCLYSTGADLASQPRILLSLGNPAKTAVLALDLAPLSGYNSSSVCSGAPCYIPKYLTPYPSCIQDDFTSATNIPAATPCSLYGLKTFSVYPTDSLHQTPDATDTGTITPSGSSYTGGLQYANNLYCRGASRICLSGYADDSKQVVAKIKTKTVTDSDGNNVAQPFISNDVRDRVIPPYVSGQEQITTFYDEQTNVWKNNITQYRTAVGSYTNGNYYENPQCTIDPDNSCGASSDPTPGSPVTTTCTCVDNSVSPAVTSTCNIPNCEWAFAVADQTTTQPLGFINGTATYSSDLYGLRNANALELGLCAPITPPSCAPSATSDGATWPNSNTAIGTTVTGSCSAGLVQSPNGPPQKTCSYVDSGYESVTLADGSVGQGCPNYSLQFSSVTNPCIAESPMPTWWPHQFLATNTYINNIQGAIVNQFNVNMIYRQYASGTTTVLFKPNSANYDPLGYPPTTTNTAATESYNNITYDICQKQISKSLTTAPRTYKDGDQEMLYLTAAQWQALWNANHSNLQWLFAPASDTAYNGCYVYDLSTIGVNATYHSSVKPAMKICKYGDKVSFSLVDFNASSYTDYRNQAYIMSSNITDYDAYVSLNFNNNDKSTVIGSGSIKDTSYNGIVVLRSGFSGSSTQTSPALPTGFVSISTAESISGLFNLSSLPSGSLYVSSTLGMAGGVNNCNLSIYRVNVDYSSFVSGATNFSVFAKTFFYKNWFEQRIRTTKGFISSCKFTVTYSNNVPGNNAANVSMFYWSNSYNMDVCNQ